MASKRPKSVAWVPAGAHADVPNGHYRSIEDESDPHGGELVVWIDEAPGDPEDGSGHFEYYNGDPGEYQSIPVTGTTASLSGTTTGSSGTGIGG